MKIEDLAEVRVWAPQARFAHVDKPFFVLSDFPWQWGSAMWSSIGGVVADPTMQLVHPEPIRVPCVFLNERSYGQFSSWGIGQAVQALASASTYYQYLSAVKLEGLLLPSLKWDFLAGSWRWATGRTGSVESTRVPLIPFPNLTGHALGFDFVPAWRSHEIRLSALRGESAEAFDAQGMVLEVGALFPSSTQLDAESTTGGYYLQFVQSHLPGNPSTPLVPPGPPSPTADRAAYVACGVSVGSGEDERIYGVVFRGNGDALIVRYDVADQAWRELRTVANAATVRMQREQSQWRGMPGASNNNAVAVPIKRVPEDIHSGEPDSFSFVLRPVAVEFRLIGERLTIRIGDTEEAYAFVEDRRDVEGNPIWTLGKAHVCGERLMNAHLSGHFLGWRRDAYLDSPPVPIGFQSDLWLEPEVRTVGEVPEGWTVEVDEDASNLEGPDVRYRLKFAGPRHGTYNLVDYAWTTPAVRSVEMMWAPSGTARPAPPYLASPEGIVVSHRFDPVTLQAGSQAVITFNNNRMTLLPSGVVGYWGEWSLARGQVGLEVWATRTSTATGWFGPPTLLGTFYGHTEGETAGQAGDSRFAMFCSDRRVQLRSPRWNLPWMDGWNAFYAIGFLAQLGGVAPGDWEFAHLVPDAPFGEGTDLGNGFGGRAPYLPVGDAGSVVTRFSGLPLWEVMAKIAQFLGYMLFFGSNGKLQFRPFRLAPGSRRFFAESDRESAGAEGCWALRVRKRHDTVRSDAVTIGIDAFAGKWEPIVFKHSEEAVVYDDLAFNHLGYRNPSVWVDSAFADPWFAWMASLEQMNVGRVPALSAQFTTWLQPDLLPLDVVSLRAPRFGMYDLDLMVVGVDHRVGSDGPGSTTITAAYVPDPLFQV